MFFKYPLTLLYKKFFKVENLCLIMALFFISCFTLQVLRVFVSGYIMMAIALLWLIITTIIRPRSQIKLIRSNILYILWLACLTMYFFTGKQSLLFQRMIDLGAILFIALMADYYIRLGNIKFYKIIVWSQLLFLVFTSIYTLIFLRIDPNLSRVIATGLKLTNRFEIGVGSYGFIYALAGFLPCLYIASRGCSIYKKLISYALILFLAVTVYVASFAFAIVLMVSLLLATLIIFLLKGNRRILSLIIIVSVVCICIAAAVFLVNNYTIVHNTFMQQRLQQIRDIFTGKTLGKETDVYIRSHDYFASIKAALTHPFLGTGAYYAVSRGHTVFGGATEWIDDLARYGIFITALLIAYLIQKFIAIYRMWSKVEYKVAVILFFSFYLTLGLINTALFEQLFIVMLVLLPLTPYAFDKKIELENRS
jgi:hypothetical protein